jgi:hypothetical protein
MNQASNAPVQLWQGVLAVLLLAIVMFSEAIIGSDPELVAPATASVSAGAETSCNECFQTAAAGH